MRGWPSTKKRSESPASFLISAQLLFYLHYSTFFADTLVSPLSSLTVEVRLWGVVRTLISIFKRDEAPDLS